MIIEYDGKYDKDIINLFIELQRHIVDLDREGYNILTANYGHLYLKKTLEEVKKYNGKILLYKIDQDILGLVVGLINNDAEDSYDFKAPRRGRITELIVSEKKRSQGIGKKLLKAMEGYLISQECRDVLLGVFAYNDRALKFYEENGYHVRMLEMTKKIRKD